MLQKAVSTLKNYAYLDEVSNVASVMQKTLLKPVSCTGYGVHSGMPVTLTLNPAPVNSGIVFFRKDVGIKTGLIPAQWDLVSDATMCTKLTNSFGVSVGTVEHLMAACVGMGLTNVRIDVDGPEIPIMDGSSIAFVDMIKESGVKATKKPVKSIRILKPVEVKLGSSVARFLPCDDPLITMKFNANGRLGESLDTYTYCPEMDDFASLLSKARTFGFYEDAQKLWSMGLARGASLENTIVINENKIMNEEGLRFDDELIRHKVLDAVGDLALAGVRLVGHFDGVNSGHALNNKLLRALFSDESAWCVETPLLPCNLYSMTA